MPDKITVTYFPFKGRAEPTRLAFVVGGIDFEDERIAPDEFGKQKEAGKFMFGSLPTMTVDGKSYAQSDAMLRYAGKLSGLYPDDPLEAMNVDIVLGAIEDVTIAIFKDSSEESRTKFAKEGVPRYFGPIEKMIQESSGKFLLGDKMSIADIKLYVTTGTLKSGMIDHVPTDILEKFEGIMECVKAVSENEKIAAWNAEHAK